MSDFHAQVSVYDCLGTVVATVRVYDLDQPAGDDRLAYQATHSFAGVGEDEPMRWLLEALVEVAEYL